MLDRVGKAAIPMLFFAGIPFLFAGPIIGIICWLLAAVIALVLRTPLRSWLGIPPAKEGPSQGQTSPPAMTGGVRNYAGAKSTHVRSRFKRGTGIENLPGGNDQPGGESYDEETTFE